MANEPDVTQLLDITRNVWTEFLGIGLAPVKSDRSAVRSSLSGCLASVTINGEWNGYVSVVCSRPLARRAAASMFGVTSDAVTADQIQDALAELANIIGGNVKALLPCPSQLSLPAYQEIPLSVLGAGAGGQSVLLSSNGDVLQVQVTETVAA